jgi:predicted transcriptional regulator
MSDSPERLLDLTATIVSAHLGHNALQADALPQLIQSIYSTLHNLGTDASVTEAVPLVPAVSIKKSVFPGYIICLKDGKQLKMLKRHLATSYGMTPDDYRKRWKLPADYPMVSPDYALKRSALATKIGLGRKRTPAAKAKAEPAQEPKVIHISEKKRGRKKVVTLSDPVG